MRRQALLFQSSSGPREPDVIHAPRDLIASACFNPRPALASRTSREASAQAAQNQVSILVRPSRAGRPREVFAMRHARTVSILVRPSRAGRRPLRILARHARVVSILVRPSRAGRQVSCIALNFHTKIHSLREPSSASPKRGAADSVASGFGQENQALGCAANLSGKMLHLWSALHRTSGASKSTALNFPYSRT